MADVRAFRGVRYSSSIVPNLSEVICPPYDIVSAREEERLTNLNKYNAIKLELREVDTASSDNKRYSHAASLFKRWIDQKVLVTDEKPSMYLVEETFVYQGKSMQRRGLVAVVRLEEFEKGIVLPHEYTRPGPKLDRLALMRACHTNFSPIMGLYRDPDNEVANILTDASRLTPIATVNSGDECGYRIWPLAEPSAISNITKIMSSNQIFVADGHHRYETALQFRNELLDSAPQMPANAAGRYIMMTLISIDMPGLLVLPYHRIFGGLNDYEVQHFKNNLEKNFEIRPATSTTNAEATELAASLEDELLNLPKSQIVAATYGLEPGKAHIIQLKDSLKPSPGAPSLEKCDMWLVHQKGIRSALSEAREAETTTFVPDSVEAINYVRNSEYQLALLLRPLPMHLFEEVVGKGERLPPKSTYFFPKLPTGLIFNQLEGIL